MSVNFTDEDSESSENEEDSNDTFNSDSEEASFDFASINRAYMKDITDLLELHSQVNCGNALALNKEMQLRLQEVRKRLQTLLQTVQQRFTANEQRLKQNLGYKRRGIGMRGAYLKGGTFYFKGTMFFKDLNCRNCPNNADYEYRKNVEGEMFPMDFELCSRHVWSLVDKTSIVQAIKEQVTDYLADRELRRINKTMDKLSKTIRVHSEKLVDLLAQVGDDFEIDWQEVSAHNLHYRHSPTSCKAMWQVYLHPRLKRSMWTQEENQRLLESAKAHEYQDWASIAEQVGRRSDYQCFVQYQTTVCYMDTERWGRWNKKDDELLLQLIQKNTMNDVINWNVVASYFPHKSKMCLHQRYVYSLDPKISHAPFTAEEDLLLLAAVEQYGEKFSCFPRTLFPNRSVRQVRSRYQNTIQHRHTIAPWSVEDDKKLMEYVTKHGTSSWLQCAELLGNHSRTGCRTRFLTIQRFFEKNPEAVLENIPRKKHCAVRRSVITKQNWREKFAEFRENPNVDFTPPKIKYERQKNIKQKRLKKLIIKSMVKAEIKSEPLSHTEPRKSRQKFNIKAETAALLQERSIKGVTKLGAQPLIPPKKSRRKRLYVERLRAVELKLYHFFKYAYNFQLGQDRCTQLSTSSLHVAVNALGFHSNSFVKDTILPKAVQRRCKSIFQQPSPEIYKMPFAYHLPPSWSTAMGFRALCIQIAQFRGSSQNDAAAVDSHSAIQVFRTRFRVLFYKTALLSRLHPTRFPNQFVQRPGDGDIVSEMDESEIELNDGNYSDEEENVGISIKQEEVNVNVNDNDNALKDRRKTKQLNVKREKPPISRSRKRCVNIDAQVLNNPNVMEIKRIKTEIEM